MNPERLQELAALNAVGALDGADLAELQRLLAEADPSAKAELAGFSDAAAVLAVAAAPKRHAPPSLKGRILGRVQEKEEQRALLDHLQKLCPAITGGFSFVPGRESGGWQALPVAGASVKPLFVDPHRGYAVVLGKLEPGAGYPAHRHLLGEEVYVLSGDLHIGDHAMKAGDFHHADAGTAHDVNYSEQGCVILAVISTQDLLAQLQPAS